MRNLIRLSLVVMMFCCCFQQFVLADSGESTRVVEDDQLVRQTKDVYPYRDKADYVLEELDLKSGDVVVDIGAGDGWWSEKMAEAVGGKGAIHAGEVVQDKVDGMKKKYESLSNTILLLSILL